MEPYEGVKEASEYLKSQGVPREYRKQILESFDRRTIRIEIAGDSTFGIRFYGGNSTLKEDIFLRRLMHKPIGIIFLYHQSGIV